jgi:secreted PhoX family phosphatase
MPTGDRAIERENSAHLFDAPLSRRQVMQGSLAAAITAMFGLPGCATSAGTKPPPLGFKPVPISSADTLIVPEGYQATALIAWGDPISHVTSSPAFRFDASTAVVIGSMMVAFSQVTDSRQITAATIAPILPCQQSHRD